MRRSVSISCAAIATCIAVAPALRAQTFWEEALPQSATDKPIALALGDLDRDGHLDLVLAGQNSGVPGVISIRWGGPYGFQQPDTCQQLLSFPGRVYVQDLNADGWPEIVVANSAHTTATIFVNGGLQSGSCRVAFTPTTTPASQGVDLIAFADLDGDGKLDLVTAGGGSHELVYQAQTPASPVGGIPQFGASIDISQAAGANAQPPQASMSYGFAKGLGVGDFDGDGTPDVAVAASSSAGPGIHVYYDRPSGWTYQGLYNTPAGQALGIAVGDFNGDGRADFAASFVSRGLVTFFNAGPPQGGVYADVFDVPSTGVGTQATPLLSGDFDGDGNVDLAYGDPATATVASVRNSGSGIFDASGEQHYAMSISGSRALITGDLDGDGDLDFVNGLYTTSSIESLFNQRNANARKPVQALQLRGGAPNVALSALDAPDGITLDQSSSATPSSPALGGYLWADAFTFQTQGAVGTRVRVRIHDVAPGVNGAARIGLVNVNTHKLKWVAQYALQNTLTDNVFDVANANQFGAQQGQIQLVLLHASPTGAFQSSVDQLGLELLP